MYFIVTYKLDKAKDINILNKLRQDSYNRLIRAKGILNAKPDRITLVKMGVYINLLFEKCDQYQTMLNVRLQRQTGRSKIM